LLKSIDPRRRWFKRAVIFLGLAALLVALARPQWGRNEMEVERTGVDLVIALDVSRSMLAPDAGGTNRLYVARTAIEQLLDSIGGDRVGLVAFAGEAFMIAPLTRDHVAVQRGLRYTTPAMISEQGSNLGAAINKAGESFERGAQGPRALLVLTDGEQLQGNAVEAARKAAQQGIRIHTAGVGSAMGARVPAERTSAFVRNALGREVVSRRDEQKLQQVSSAGGGVYTRIEEAHSKALVGWFQRTAASLPRSTEKRVLNEPREQFQWPLALALVLLALEWVVDDRRRSRPERSEQKAQPTLAGFASPK
jgi:Ca-activated chloride channel family protein